MAEYDQPGTPFAAGNENLIRESDALKRLLDRGPLRDLRKINPGKGYKPNPRGNYERCPECGARVILPCVACAAADPDDDDESDDIGIIFD